MPYPLPEGDAYTGVLRWFLVAVPDKPEYIRAGLGAYTEFTKWFLWERDDLKRGADAADAWDDAVAATLEALEMGFPDILLGHIDEVEDLLRALQSMPCCNAPTVSYEGDHDPNLQSEIEDGVGDPPASYGDDPIATWDEWDDYKCEAAYFMVERAAALCEELADIQSWDTPLNAEIIGLALGRIPAIGDVFKAAWELVWQLLELSWDTIIDLETAAGEIRAAEEDIACAIFLADGPDAAAAAFKTAVQDAVTQTGASLVVPWFPYDMWANIIYEGEFVNAEGTTIAIDSLLTPGTNDCSCVEAVDFFLGDFDLVDGNLFVWDGTQYVDYNWPSPYDAQTGETIRIKGNSGTSRTNFSASLDTSGTPRELMDVTIDVVGLSGDVLVQTFLNSGTAIHNQQHDVSEFPLNFTGIDGVRMENADLQFDVFPDRYATIVINALG